MLLLLRIETTVCCAGFSAVLTDVLYSGAVVFECFSRRLCPERCVCSLYISNNEVTHTI